MCEFCSRHGEGKTWYLNAKNYSSDLAGELGRKKFIGEFYQHTIVPGNRKLTFLEKTVLPWLGLPGFIRAKLTRDMKRTHFGQVVPIEDVERILTMARSVTRLACGCKWAKEKKESRLCYGIAMGPPAWYDDINMDFFGSAALARFENLQRDEALDAMRTADEQGYIHSIWTFHTPFIGAICNCEKSYCLAMRSNLNLQAASMFRAEYVAAIDALACSGCRACLERCPFNAIAYNLAENSCFIDRTKCYGCGICRPVCQANAISLPERRSDPVACNVW